ncbi:MAG: thioredoxin domain-containing protein [Syntrophomonadaceae bacterium]|jgi:uncharacterized protein YyaL (SSP411 family)|nr:thioredoxin domain-containing protein [Syntrophomonadaceae bacterium]
MSNFRFSPRPNRAHEIEWHEWSNEPFALAQKTHRLLLLSISAVWCHWCHVMDETTYSDPEIIEIINQRFVPIRVDSDRRPDINQRYNLGGWPTTAILNADGELITGATYLPSEQMRDLLTRIDELHQLPESELKSKFQPTESSRFRPVPEPEILLELVEQIENRILARYDQQWGGFGTSPKFPMVDALFYAIEAHHRKDGQWEEVFTHTMNKMASGGMFDHIEGGFFRYSTDRQWRIPHYEKMLEDNSQLMEAYLQAWQVSNQDEFLDTARHVFNYLYKNLYLADQHAWAGSQDADENYYALDEKERRLVQAPFIDTTIYTDWNSMMARSLLLMGVLTDDRHIIDLGINTLESLWERSWVPERGLAHYYIDGQAHLYRQLTDVTAYGQACNLAFQVTGDRHWLERSGLLADFCLFHLEAPEGGFYDIIPCETAPGALGRPHLDLQLNSRTALWLLELTALTDNQPYEKAAKKALSIWQDDYVLSYGPLAAGYARALLAAEQPWTTVTVVGEKHDAQARKMVEESLRQYRLHRVVTWIDPVVEPGLAAAVTGALTPEKPTAYVCTGQTCLPPAHTIDELLEHQNQPRYDQ